MSLLLWETCAGASTDAYYGIPHFRMAAQASDLEEALHKEDGDFQLQHIQTQCLQLRGRAVASGDGQATCSQFQAASQTARWDELFQWHGILATVCPEYVVHAMHREGNECFAMYKVKFAFKLGIFA